MATLQATFGLTTLSSDSAFAVHMVWLFVPDCFDVAFNSFTHRGGHQGLRLWVGQMPLLLRVVSLRSWCVKTTVFVKQRWCQVEANGIWWKKLFLGQRRQRRRLCVEL
jgi:hypothetical protein